MNINSSYNKDKNEILLAYSAHAKRITDTIMTPPCTV